MTKLTVAENHRYFTKDGKPFIWLADTCWTMPQRMKWDDVAYYMQKRKQQGFTVLQIVALDPEQDREMRNPSGIPALQDQDLLKPNEAYFAYLDRILDEAEKYGFYVLLLPIWGELVVGHNWSGEYSEKCMTVEKAYAYGEWMGSRYRTRENILWCLGGDRMPIHLGTDYRNVWRLLAEGIAKGVLGRDLRYDSDREQWQQLLMTYHACFEMETGECSTMSYWTEADRWISFTMIQSGHGVATKNYQLIEKEYQRARPIPVFDGEPAYEMMPTSWPPSGQFHGDWIVRKRAYWSLFSGAFGHTYGHSSVWCMISEKERDAFRSVSWFEALEQPGARQMKFLRDFVESVDISLCKPDQSILLAQAGMGDIPIDDHRQACVDQQGRWACIYFPSGGTERISLASLKANTLFIWWFSPRDGCCYDADHQWVSAPAQTIQTACLPVLDTLEISSPTSGPENDWVCVLQSDKIGPFMPGMARQYIEAIEGHQVKKVFDW